MHIEINRTKTKLTKALIDQMLRNFTTEVLKTANVLGFFVNVIKRETKTILLEYGGDYYTSAMDWETGNEAPDGTIFAVYRNFTGSSIVKKFKTKEDRDNWFDAYIEVCKKAEEKGHIYI